MSIDKQLVKNILVDNIENIQRLDFVTRKLTLENRMPTILIGVRRCGKSFLLYQKMNELVAEGYSWEDFLYVNFEDERLIGFEVNDFNLLLEAYYSISNKNPVLFLDEIQNIDGWEKFARRIADEKRMIFITGSNSKMLSKEMASVLGGRFVAKSVFPYSFREFLKAKALTIDDISLLSTRMKGEIFHNFEEYFRFGGFPELISFINKREYLSSIYNKIYLGDIVLRYKVTNSLALEVMIKKLADTVRHPISFNRLRNIVNAVGVSIGTSTIIQYLEYVIESQIIFSIVNFAGKLVVKATTPKYYFIDNGLLNLFLIDADPALLENLVAVALMEKYGAGAVYYYHNNVEVDFYIPEEGLGIQACYSLGDMNTRDREVNALVKLAKYADLKKLLIITYDDEEGVIEEKGLVIEVVPVWKWLLNN